MNGIALMMIQVLLPASSEMIYSGEGWDYTKVPIPAGNFNITGPLLTSTCANVGLTTPCPSPKRCYSQKMCVTTAHSAGYCTGNLYILQQKLTAQYGNTGYSKLRYSFVYMKSRKNVSEDVKVDSACGYWPSSYCTNGEEKPSTGSYFAMCVSDSTMKPTTTLSTTTKGDSHFWMLIFTSTSLLGGVKIYLSSFSLSPLFMYL